MIIKMCQFENISTHFFFSKLYIKNNQNSLQINNNNDNSYGNNYNRLSVKTKMFENFVEFQK